MEILNKEMGGFAKAPLHGGFFGSEEGHHQQVVVVSCLSGHSAPCAFRLSQGVLNLKGRSQLVDQPLTRLSLHQYNTGGPE